MIKRILLVFLCLAVGIPMSAQTSVEWKHALIEDVNSGRFTDAIAKMPYASWEFDYDMILDLDSALVFYDYCDSLDIQPTCLVDSFACLWANTYFAYGKYYQDINQKETAILCYNYVCLIFQDRKGLLNLTYVTSLIKLGELYEDLGDYNKAIQYNLAVLRICKVVLGKRFQNEATLVYNIGGLYRNLKDYAKAEQYYLEALQIRKEVLGENHPDYATFLNNLGVLYKDMGNYAKAEQYYLEALRIHKEVLGENHPDYALSLNNLGSLYQDMGNYAKAEQYYLEALRIIKEVLGENHPNYALSLNNIGGLYKELGDYAKAEQYCLEALQIFKEVLGENHPDYALGLNNIGVLYQALGNYAKAEPYFLEALRIIKEVLGENHPDYATFLNNIGGLYQALGNYSKAERYYLEALQIRKEVLGEKHPNHANSLNNLGMLYGNMRNYAKAEQYHLEALQIRKEVFGEKHPKYALSLNNIGGLYKDMGDYAKAERYYLEALQIRKEVFGENHPDYANSLNNKGRLYYDMGDYAKAEFYVSQAEVIYRQQILNSITFMSEYERSQFLRENVFRFKIYFSIYYKADAHVSAYNLLLFTKGLQLSMTDAVRRTILESGDSTLIADFEHLVTLKAYINKMETDNPTSPYLAQTREQAETLEKDLTRRSTAFQENQRQWQITWQNVQKALPKQSVAIEFSVLPNDTCVALLLDKKDKEPRMITLSPDDITNRTLWAKLMPELKGIQTIYFSPDGALHQLPLESFAYDSTSTMSDRFNMVRLSSTRELVRNKQSHKQETATIYGGIHYNVSSDDLLAQSRQYDENLLLAHRGIADDTINRGSVQYLPGTKIEAEAIDKMLQSNHISSHLYTASGANEESFKALNGQKQNILHIGTHGFCWPDSTAQKKDFFAQRMQMIGDNQPRQQMIDPLDRCGLLFAGANMALSGHSDALPSGIQDGILTAKEISLLDLRGCDLVVLSACETAKGDVTSEGVFGLQRAFKMAGVQTIIMSLWPVDDRATQMLMTEFYTNWIVKQLPKREAFKNAQNAVRYAVDEDGDRMFEDPVYWAAFIMLD